jgi:hypothetical protein
MMLWSRSVMLTLREAWRKAPRRCIQRRMELRRGPTACEPRLSSTCSLPFSGEGITWSERFSGSVCRFDSGVGWKVSELPLDLSTTPSEYTSCSLSAVSVELALKLP